ncbi:hypothetical protein VTK56DRAFT_3388 [Thermocarpiscus australiensis]
MIVTQQTCNTCHIWIHSLAFELKVNPLISFALMIHEERVGNDLHTIYMTYPAEEKLPTHLLLPLLSSTSPLPLRDPLSKHPPHPPILHILLAPLLDIELAHGPEPPPLAARIGQPRVAHVVDHAPAAAARGGAQVGQRHGADARLADQAHGGDVEARRGRRRRAREALQDGARPARVGRQVHVDGGHEGRGAPGYEGRGDEAAESDCVGEKIIFI